MSPPAKPDPRLAVATHTLVPGQSLSPYQFEHGNESWALVVDGSPTLRDPDGEHVLDPGDVVCFPRGPAGAHQLSNAGAERATVIVISTRIQPSVTVFPDDGTLLVTPPGRTFRERDAIAPAARPPSST